MLKHFWAGVRKVTNASHTELNAIWKQMVCNVHLLIPGEDWLAILTWGCATAWLRQEGPVSQKDFDTFLELFHLAHKALVGSSFDRCTAKSGHRKLENLAWHDLIHGPWRIMLWGKFWSTGFFEQCHDKLLKRLGGARPAVARRHISHQAHASLCNLLPVPGTSRPSASAPTA